ncbi:hypothetical protein Tco_0668610 [Tanacetum coccineum]
MGVVDIDTLTMEQYLALTRGNQAPGVVKHAIGNNVNFEIKSQFMRELREDTFSGNKNDDAYEHVGKVLDIVRLFNIPGVTHDKGPIPDMTPARALKLIQTLADHLQKWHNMSRRTSSGSSDGIDAIRSKMDSLGRDMKKLKENVHAIQGPIPDMTPVRALKLIQTLADHLQKWHHMSRRTSSGSSNGIAAIRSKMDSLGRDMKKLKENVHAIQEVKYGEFGRSFPYNGRNGARYRVGLPGYYTRMKNRPPFGEKKPSLEDLVNKHIEESTRRRNKNEEWMKKL